MKLFLQSLKLFLVMSLLTGILYPLAITLLGQRIFPFQANGSILKSKGENRGSELLGQKFEKANLFWSRPSAIDYATIPSGATNFGPTSADLKKQIEDRRTKLGDINAPQDLLTSSGSGLDPHISPEAAAFQVPRVAKARQMSEKVLLSMIDSFTEKRDFGVLGEPRVNVLKLNLALEGK